MIQVASRPHPEIEGYLGVDPHRHVFPLYVCEARPRERSLAALQGDRIVGAVVCGRDFGIPAVQSGWLFADGAEATRALLSALAEADRLDGLQLPWEDAALVAAQPGYRASRDVYLTRRPGPARPAPLTGVLVQVDQRVLDTLDMPPEIRRSIGDLRQLPSDAALWALNVNGRLLALADTMVRYRGVVTIQQVFCAHEARRQGHSRALLTQLVAHASLVGATLTWLASAENAASIGLATGLGFADDRPLAAVEREGSAA